MQERRARKASVARESYASIAESYVSMTERYVGMTENYVCKSDVRQTL